MPTYTFYNSETDEQFDDFMSWSQRETYLKENPHIEPMLMVLANVDGPGEGHPNRKDHQHSQKMGQ